MSADCRVYDLLIDPDPRLAAGAGGVAHFLAEAAGLTSEVARALQHSIFAACLEAFESLTGKHVHIRLTFTWQADKIEVAVAQRGSAPAVGLDRIAGFAAQLGGATALGGIDRVQYETKDGLSVTRLTKFLRPAPKVACQQGIPRLS